MIKNLKIQKRQGDVVSFDVSKIRNSIRKVMEVGNTDLLESKKEIIVDNITRQVVEIVEELYSVEVPNVEDIQDIVIGSIRENGYEDLAIKYENYRGKRESVRKNKVSLIKADTLLDNYISEMDWRVNENANMGFSLQGLNNHIVESVTKQYWLNEVYSEKQGRLHKNGDIHIHDLGLLAPYCCGWDLEALLRNGFGGAEGKVESSPPKHLQALLGQLVNWLYTLQGEAAGAQAVSSLDTYVAPFIRYDGLSYDEVKKIVRGFIFNLNIPTRVGFQTPFTNITLDIKPHSMLRNMPVIIGGKTQKETYGEFQEEMDIFNKAFCEVMIEGDGLGRSFSFPIPTINITDDFPWDSNVANSIMEMTKKFGTPYFANFVNSDMSPEDVRSMCCRLRLDNKELRKRGGGLFGANPLTGSINVVTLNMARLGYVSNSTEEFKSRIKELMEEAKDICDKKRAILEDLMEKGLYPYSKPLLQGIKDMQGGYFDNHFSTIGLNGMNEACLNLLGKDIASDEGREFTLEIMNFMNDVISIFQQTSGTLWNLEASPSEGATYRFARMDKKFYPNIITQGDTNPYYTNSTQLPVDYTPDIFDAIEHQGEIQSLYTGGTVLHGFIGEKIESVEVLKDIIKKAFKLSPIPYMTITPTFSICPQDGYLEGEQKRCPKCSSVTEVWSRVVGFHRPVKSWNKGKQEEYIDRVEFIPQKQR